jgi:hypothetical protein
MSAPVIIGGIVLGGGLYLWWKSRQPKPASDCYNACDAQSKITGVPAFACRAACDLLGGPAKFACPPGTTQATDFRASNQLHETSVVDSTGQAGWLLKNMNVVNSQGGVTACVPNKSGPLPVVIGSGQQTTFNCSNLPANVTWDPGTSSWRRMAAGEKRNLGPCGPSSGVGTSSVMHALPIGSTL